MAALVDEALRGLVLAANLNQLRLVGVLLAEMLAEAALTVSKLNHLYPRSLQSDDSMIDAINDLSQTLAQTRMIRK